MIFIIGISTFVCISLAMLGAYWLLYKPQSATTERLRRLNNNAPTTASIPLDEPGRGTELAERFASPLMRLAPPSAAEAKKLQKQLMQAGFRSDNAPIFYRALQLVTLFGFPGTV